MQTITQCKRPIVLFTISLLIAAGASMRCGSKSPLYWPPDGTVLLNQSWNVPLSDSSSVLQKEGEVWILPAPPDTAVEKTYSRHLSARQVTHPDLFEHVDQVVLHDNGTGMTEYYCFRRDGVFVLGYSRTAGDLHTRYNPPLLFLPNTLKNRHETLVHETTPTLYDAAADSTAAEQKMRIALTLKERGVVRIENRTSPALWVRMRLSQDAVVAYGNDDLVLNDALMMQSDILLVKDFGPILEWGVRSKENEHPGNASEILTSDSFVQITLHQSF
ncbi:hypothetical protein JXA02_14290 [candidate division KSB1 bacterium]|nr:hypothetical protein [candidate division KSB1 bacterium]RQW01726.1 MAG: hypothetical protein EH222_14655 [candidate division KSB1 bacterium]